jgi:pyridoxamine 5'-phosphate oxidase
MSSSVGNVDGENGSQTASLTGGTASCRPIVKLERSLPLAGCQPAESPKLSDIPSEQRLDKSSSAHDPIALFQTWFTKAIESGIAEPSAMTVATVDVHGSPDARMLLLKGVDEHGFVFYTNLESAKARALVHDPRVALCFYWAELGKQVRVRGRAEMVGDEEADKYFATRPRLSQISAWASKQSQPMRGYFELETQIAKSTFHFGVSEISRPPFWSGFRVVPERIEFWLQKPFRRHQRILYESVPGGWQKRWLYP